MAMLFIDYHPIFIAEIKHNFNIKIYMSSSSVHYRWVQEDGVWTNTKYSSHVQTVLMIAMSCRLHKQDKNEIAADLHCIPTRLQYVCVCLRLHASVCVSDHVCVYFCECIHIYVCLFACVLSNSYVHMYTLHGQDNTQL